MKLKQWVGLFLAVLILFMGTANIYWFGANKADDDKTKSEGMLTQIFSDYSTYVPGTIFENYYAQLDVVGTMVSSAGEFDTGMCDCSKLVEVVDALIDDEYNLGIFLNVDSPGGEAYAADVLYLKLKEYKEKTGRPIVAYFNSMSASGGYYVSCAADYIVSQRSSWIGSIGVYVQITDTTVLEKKIGLNRYLIRSDENKGMGSSFIKMTKEQKKIYQGLVDDAYEQFMGVVKEGRKELSKSAVRRVSDGRVYTANQSLEEGLIDDIGSTELATSTLVSLGGGVEGKLLPMAQKGSFASLFSSLAEKFESEQGLRDEEGSVVMYLAK